MYLVDEVIGGYYIFLIFVGNCCILLEEVEQYKCGYGEEIWFVVKLVYEKMVDIVVWYIEGQGIIDLWLVGGFCL